MNKKIFALVVLSMAALAGAQEEQTVCMIYFTGVGCPHCAQSDPFIFGEMLSEYNQSLVILEYEIYQEPRNAHMLMEYGTYFDVGYGIPKLVIDSGDYLDGDGDIKEQLKGMINEKIGSGTRCVLINSSAPFEEVDLNALPGRPKIWCGGRVLFKEDGTANASSGLLRQLLRTPDLSNESEKYFAVKPSGMPISGGEIQFDRALKVDGWVLQWNEENSHTTRIEYSLWHYLDWFPYIVLSFGAVILILIHKSEKNVKDKRGV